MSILFTKMTPTAREIAEAALRSQGILAPDAPLEYAFEVHSNERDALEKARVAYDHKIDACPPNDHDCIAQMAIAKAKFIRSTLDAAPS